MTKVVYNNCFGGFGLSEDALAKFKRLKGLPADKYISQYSDIPRDDPILVQIVEEGKASSGLADLKIRDVPPGVKYRIDEYDGSEQVMTIDDYEWSIA